MNAVAGYIPEAVVERPGQFVVLIDEAETLNDGYFLALEPGGANNTGRFVDCPSIMHNNGAVLLFFDGHSKWIRARHTREQARIDQCIDTVPKHYFCPKIPFPESLQYAQGCQREN